MKKTLDELKQEATDLGINYNKNIGAAKLAEKIEEFYASQETGEAKINEALRERAEKVEKPVLNKVATAREAAMKTHIVTIVDNDQRENHLTTVVPCTCTNSYFDLGTKRIPLNTPVELQQGFIDTLREIRIPMHTKDPQSGQSRTVMRARYSINIDDTVKQD